MKRYLLLSSVFMVALSVQGQQAYRQTMKLMGSRFDISVVANNYHDADRYIKVAEDEIIRIEKLISSWDESSQTSDINRNAGIKPVRVDLELFQLIERALSISKLTDGAFDISYASMDRNGNLMEV